MHKIVIKEGFVELLEERVVRTVSLDEFKQACATKRVTTPVLPVGTIMFYGEGNHEVFVIFREQERRIIKHFDHEYMVAAPHEIYVIMFQDNTCTQISTYYTLNPPENHDEPVFGMPLPNRYHDGHLCLANLFLLPPDRSKVHRVDNAIEQLKTTRHNNDLMGEAWACTPVPWREAIRAAGGRENSGVAPLFAYWRDWTTEAGDNWKEKLREVSWVPSGTLKQVTSRI